MTPHDDHSQQRQPLFFPVVIATVLLTIIGMVGGYLLSERRSGESGRNESSGRDLLPAGQECLQQTQEMGAKFNAVGTLRQVLRVRTESRSVAWICQDEVGRLFYHANKGGADAPWVENKTALFLADVNHEGDYEFWATAADGNVFRVSNTRLAVEYTDGRIEEQSAVPE
ncbi:hypothetical protein QLQ12_25810 [Actinoplanes sp. NEAU-A12]|uniref:Uncharacterized protein n=1 Tax=Actinoplanes sandaracinus TaxID=3045177 RepID=A0ABT6WQM4_9ACTN|nr:hypothetical protein [Actinoplanes sandaracinus]MDI6102039.1 hypothetical protein [Actinoplanes sandaracinus]